MRSPVTVLWLVDGRECPSRRDSRFRHVDADAARVGAAVTTLISDGAVLAVVANHRDAEQALAYGADETLLADEYHTDAFERAISRTVARAQARAHRDLLLIDLVRKDDTAALELLAAALGQELGEPLARASREGKALASSLQHEAEPALQASALAASVDAAAQVVARARELLATTPTDELVDLGAAARAAISGLEPAVRSLAELDVRIAERPCLVGLPRWQAVMLVASLLENAVTGVAAKTSGQRHVSVCVDAHEGAAVIEVSDNGVGMEEQDRPYVADPFFTTTGRGRMGLGLTLTSARVRRAGGSLIIESDAGVGTTVRAYLPLAAAHQALGDEN